MNIVVLSGRLVNEPELAYTNSGIAIYRNTLAVEDFTRGEKQTYFFKFNCFKTYAETVAKHSFKGQAVTISGRLVLKKWLNNDGQKNSAVEINCERMEYHTFKEKVETPELLRGSIEISDEELLWN